MASTLCNVSNAKIVLPHLISDGMIIQQDTDINLWGKANANSVVTVSPSWSRSSITVKAEENGNWTVKIKSPKASYSPLSILFKDEDSSKEIKNILSGEVWVAGGQSNMEMPVEGFDNCPVEGYNNIISEASDCKGIRYFKVPTDNADFKPKDDANSQWIETSPITVAKQSAIGYFFASRLSKTLKVPVGIIEANMSGSRIEGWLNKENLKELTNEPTDEAEIEKKYPKDKYYLRPLVYGNGIINPVKNFSIRGFIFYQGCSNALFPGTSYSKMMKALVNQWRTQFNNINLPFYFVEIAPYGGYDDSNPDGETGAILREEQHIAAHEIANCGIVCTNDCVYPFEIAQIHPRQKRKVAVRLAEMALNKTYGHKEYAVEYPEFKNAKVLEDGSILIWFNHLEGGLSRNTDIKGFEVAGSDKIFHEVSIEYNWDNNCLKLKAKDVKNPKYLRYCFHNFKLGNLANGRGLPVVPFRTKL